MDRQVTDSGDAGLAYWFADAPAAGSWNMALDEALLQQAERSGHPWLRFYQWQEPTLSLGYFQRYANRHMHAASEHCVAVRRASGGGAILHDQELTYSFVLPASHPLARRPETSYLAMHQSLMVALAEQQISVSLCQLDGSQIANDKPKQPFLCFQRRATGDVLLTDTAGGEWKIAGSAQRRHRGAILQHGSVLLRRSAAAPELPGIGDLAGRVVNLQQLQQEWCQQIERQLGLRLVFQSPLAEVIESARMIEAEKFGSQRWLEAR
ncbi:MAG: lipoate--protein ligase [Planctomycetota bacterium]|nr:lipoate--protein ligase [Planctomycetota bacterium]